MCILSYSEYSFSLFTNATEMAYIKLSLHSWVYRDSVIAYLCRVMITDGLTRSHFSVLLSIKWRLQRASCTIRNAFRIIRHTLCDPMFPCCISNNGIYMIHCDCHKKWEMNWKYLRKCQERCLILFYIYIAYFSWIFYADINQIHIGKPVPCRLISIFNIPVITFRQNIISMATVFRQNRINLYII